MALGTYNDLIAAIPTWLARAGDASIIGTAEDFVTLCESRLNRTLRLRRLVTTTELTGTASSRQLTLPTDYNAPISLWLTTDSRYERMRFSPAGFTRLDPSNGYPSAWMINGSNIDLDIPCDQAHTFDFRYRQLLDLVTDGTNWLLTTYPDVYLFGSLVEACSFQKGLPAMLPVWEKRLEKALSEIGSNEVENETTELAVDAGILAAAGGGRYNVFTDQ